MILKANVKSRPLKRTPKINYTIIKFRNSRGFSDFWAVVDGRQQAGSGTVLYCTDDQVVISNSSS